MSGARPARRVQQLLCNREWEQAFDSANPGFWPLSHTAKKRRALPQARRPGKFTGRLAQVAFLEIL